MRITRFYEEVLGANLTNQRWSWGAYKPQTDELFLRVWTDRVERTKEGSRVQISDSNYNKGSQGFGERLRHIEQIRNGAQAYGIICEAKDTHASGARTIQAFDEDKLFLLGRIVVDGPLTFAEIIEEKKVSQLQEPSSSFSRLLPEIQQSLKTKDRSTTNLALVHSRLGQGAFRQEVLGLWSYRCCVTGIRLPEAIRASHIKPWRDSSDDERLDPYNGLPLIATLDALFDAGLVTFANDGLLRPASRISKENIALLGLRLLSIKSTLPPKTIEYLEYHRDRVFVDFLENSD